MFGKAPSMLRKRTEATYFLLHAALKNPLKDKVVSRQELVLL